jgi:hypothetical protein
MGAVCATRGDGCGKGSRAVMAFVMVVVDGGGHRLVRPANSLNLLVLSTFFFVFFNHALYFQVLDHFLQKPELMGDQVDPFFISRGTVHGGGVFAADCSRCKGMRVAIQTSFDIAPLITPFPPSPRSCAGYLATLSGGWWSNTTR